MSAAKLFWCSRLFTLTGWFTVVALGLGGLSGCAAVKPYEREYLADRIMDFSADQSEDGIERHWVETREGSSGGLGGSGGGCACN